MDLMLLVADLKLQVADLIHEVAGLRMEVPELRPGEIRLNLTTGNDHACCTYNEMLLEIVSDVVVTQAALLNGVDGEIP